MKVLIFFIYCLERPIIVGQSELFIFEVSILLDAEVVGLAEVVNIALATLIYMTWVLELSERLFFQVEEEKRLGLWMKNNDCSWVGHGEDKDSFLEGVLVDELTVFVEVQEKVFLTVVGNDNQGVVEGGREGLNFVDWSFEVVVELSF